MKRIQTLFFVLYSKVFNIFLFYCHVTDTIPHVSTRNTNKLSGHKCRILKFNVINTVKIQISYIRMILKY
jgi:hypothetical protein